MQAKKFKIIFILFVFNFFSIQLFSQVLDGNDEIEVFIPSYPELSGRYSLNTDGYIHFRLIPPFSLDGLSVKEAEKMLTDSLSQYLRSVAGLKVSLLKEWNEISVLGHVQNPGTWKIPDDATLPDAIAVAGGYLPKARLNRIEVQRKHGEPRIQTFNYEKFLFDGDLSVLPKLQAGDIVFIPKGLGEVNTSDRSVYVMGAVRTPGIYEITSKTTILDVISFAGGFLSNANLKNIKVIPDASQDRKTEKFNLKKLNKKKKPMPRVYPGDTIMVAEKSKSYFGLTLQILTATSVVISAYSVLSR